MHEEVVAQHILQHLKKTKLLNFVPNNDSNDERGTWHVSISSEAQNTTVLAGPQTLACHKYQGEHTRPVVPSWRCETYPFVVIRKTLRVCMGYFAMRKRVELGRCTYMWWGDVRRVVTSTSCCSVARTCSSHQCRYVHQLRGLEFKLPLVTEVHTNVPSTIYCTISWCWEGDILVKN